MWVARRHIRTPYGRFLGIQVVLVDIIFHVYTLYTLYIRLVTNVCLQASAAFTVSRWRVE